MAFPKAVYGVLAFSLILAVPAASQQAPVTAPAPAPVTPQAPAAIQLPPPNAAADPKAATLPGLTGIDTTAWLYKGSDLTPEADWKFGTLPNGLRFAVRRNGVPPGQVAVRVRIDAGSLHEQDGERGFAHFIEHLSFRGSEYVPDGEAKRVWQRFGVTFGSDSNASTTPTQTVYKLDLPGATPANLDESLKILSGMMDSPTLTDAAVTAERPVVLAEQREQPGPQVKLGDAVRGLFFAGQPLADRSPIGSIKTLEAATGASVKAFHDRWYRPERAVVVISGDMDPLQLAQLVVKNFSGWKREGANPADPDFGKPDPAKPTAATIVEPSTPPIVAMATLRPWRFNADTVIFNQRRLVDTLAARLISRRLETRARAGGSFLQASVSVDDVSRSANGTFVNIVPVGDDWAAALKDVRAVIADAMATPPSQQEVDRELADFDTIMRTQVETARVEAGGKQADDMVDALDIRETTTGPDVSYAVLKDAIAKGMFSPAALLASTRKIFQGDATRAIVNTRTAEPGVAAKLSAALQADVSGIAATRVVQGAVDFSKLPALGAPGTVASRETLAQLEMEKVVFANGVRLLVYPNKSESGRVYVRVRFGNGYNALPTNRPAAAWAGDIALWASGVGPLKQGDLDQLVSGRRIGLDFDVTDDAFVLGAMTSPADYPDQLRLMAAKLVAPGWDPAPVARARNVGLAAYAGFEGSPDGVLTRDLENQLRAGDARWGIPKREAIAKLTAADFKALWQPLLATGPIEVSVFGDVETQAAIDAVAKSFGAMPARKPDARKPAPVRFPAHVATPVTRYHTGTANQAAAVIAWPTGGGIDGIQDSRRLDVLAQIFSDRLFEKLRQAAGASYSPQVQSQWPIGLASGGRLVAIGQVAPDKVDFFFKTAREIAADLAANPIAGDELQRIMRPMGQYILRASTGNQFWLQQLGGATFDPRRVTATENIAKDFVAITPQELQATAAKYLRPEADWTMQVLPKK
jgi:zinc protease